MKTKLLLGTLTLFFAGASYADTTFVDCNLSGLDKIKDEDQSIKVFRNRHSNKGKGNGGESVDILVDLVIDPVTGLLVTTDVQVTCITTADEETGGTLSVRLPDGTVLPIDSVPERDPNDPV